MDTEILEKIRAHYAKEYSSSPHDVDDDDIRIIIEQDCRCSQCAKSIFELYDFPSIQDGQVWCEDCDRNEHYTYCPICENDYENPTIEGGDYLVISKQAIDNYGINAKPGFYKVLRYPYYRACLVGGFESLFEDAIELIRECDINSMIHKLYPHAGEEKVSADSCCEDCMKKYTGQTEIKNEYFDNKHGRKRVALEKKVIAEGK